MTLDSARRLIVGRAIPMPGNDIDTDRIIPARYLKSVTFEGLGDHVFGDDRLQDPEHPFNQKAYEGASILVVGHNFGCGSSRQHAPEALKRWGICGIVGGSFGEIFFGNCTTLGIPCVTLGAGDLEWLQRAVAREPRQEMALDMDGRHVRFGDRTIQVAIPDGARSQLLGGTWNATGILLEAGAEIERVAKALPYVSGY